MCCTQEENIRPSVITPNLQFSSTSRERFRWNHRSHHSIDSDSSFESEHENDLVPTGPWIFSKTVAAIEVNANASRCSSVGSISRRESISSNDQPDYVLTDTENENDLNESITSISSGHYKVSISDVFEFLWIGLLDSNNGFFSAQLSINFLCVQL